MRPFLSSLAFVAFFGLVGLSAPQNALASKPCDAAALPPQIGSELKSRFAGWRPKQLSDLDADNQRVWLESPNGKACPGIAIGHFESAKQTSYAVLLVPESRPTHGYKIVVLSKDSNEKLYVSTLLEKADEETYSGLVIMKVKPGAFSDLETSQEIQTKLDGVVVEWLEKGAVLYYWSSGRYRRISISD